MILRTEGLRRAFGTVTALDGVDLAFPPGRITSIVGPNGAGKSTFLDLVSGFLRPDAGSVFLGDQEVTGLAPAILARRGVVRTFQSTRLFESATVLDNVKVGCLASGVTGVLDALLRTARLRREEEELEARAREALERVGGSSLAHLGAGTLGPAERKRVAIAMALAVRPRLLLLDEPAAGVGAAEAGRLGELLRGLVHSGITVCMVEHRMGLVAEFSDRVVVLDRGRVLADGPPDDVLHDPAVFAVYLGVCGGA